ncbi:MAG: pyrroline-5-carboxylate reductase [Novosphingobium sp.]
MDDRKILIVGCGNMGGALLAGWLAGGLPPQSFTVVDPVLESVPAGVTLLRDPPAGSFDLLVLGIKPQMLDAVAPSLNSLAGPGTTLLSILAGVELDSLARHFPDAGAIVRLMPNLSAALGKSPLALAATRIDAAGKVALEDALAPLGSTEWLDEAQFDLVTALAGSGPAFVYRFIDALATGAESLGMPRGQAERLALATAEGAVALAAGAGVSPGELARKVASPGGTTEAGLRVLDQDGALLRLIESTLRAARDRGAEMGAQSRDGGKR